MTIEEILKKDWQLATFTLLADNNARMRTILENQIEILTVLHKADKTEMTEKVNSIIKENKEKVNEMLQKNIPDYPDGGRN